MTQGDKQLLLIDICARLPYYEGLFPRNEEALDYVLEHHFDFRGLIPMGLALEAPEGMYKF